MATPTPESPEDKPSSSRMLESPDVILVGSGIMSATLAVMLARLDPALRIQVLEASPGLAREASDGWNNSGTGHAGVCELSYTPERDALGRVPIGRALRIFEQFEHSRQFWGPGRRGHPGGAGRVHPSGSASLLRSR
jgi:malate dehydrogenase (quinone)